MMENNSEMKILLVDDREENLLALETILEDDRYSFVKARSGKEALKCLLEDQDFCLIIMDVVMPGMDGLETAELIYSREKLKNTPIIFLTAMDIEENIYKGYQAGAVDYISKPVVPALLRAKVGAFVELSIKNKKLIAQEEKLKAINKSLQNEIKERKLSEDKVKALNKDLKSKLNELQALDAFAYSVSHDLMSPLNNISGLANFLLNDYSHQFDDKVQQVLSMIVKGTQKMSGLIKDLLLFSRQANAELVKAETDMTETVKGVIKEVAEYKSLDNFKIQIHDLPDAVCDKKMLKQVWINFISNAVKYSQKSNSPCIDVGGRRENGKCVYYVKDNGVGFDMNNYDKLFGAFQRLHSSADFDGTGVGLAIVKRIIERHGGKVWAESTLGEGATFYFSL